MAVGHYTHGVSIGFEDRLRSLVSVLGASLRGDTQRAAFGRHAAGLLSDFERKSVEPIASTPRKGDLTTLLSGVT